VRGAGGFVVAETLPEEGFDVGQTVVETLDDGEDFRPQASRQDDRLGDVGTGDEFPKHFPQVVLGDGHPLEGFERQVSLVQSDYYDGHLPLPFPTGVLPQALHGGAFS
jgi:hypothetical protein